jgi:transposase-like protein
MEDSALGLDKWMAAVWMLVAAKNGISSHELHRALGITQKSAWFLLHRIREALKQHTFDHSKIGGEGNTLEADETFVGGVTKNMHKAQRIRAEGKGPYKNKTIVHGILDRDLRKVRATVVPNVSRETLQNAIFNNVKYGSTIYTDNAVAYDNGMQRRFIHDVVNKTETYVRGQVHVNGMENFWSLLKRSLRGTYVAVEPFHLSRYVGEQVFRYNYRKDGERKMTDAERFAIAMSQIAGRRLTYSDLTGKEQSPREEATGEGKAEEVPF